MAKALMGLYRSLDITRPPSTGDVRGTLRGPKDVPILSDALACGASVLLTGDKDLLESGVTNPLALSPAGMREILLEQR